MKKFTSAAVAHSGLEMTSRFDLMLVPGLFDRFAYSRSSSEYPLLVSDWSQLSDRIRPGCTLPRSRVRYHLTKRHGEAFFVIKVNEKIQAINLTNFLVIMLLTPQLCVIFASDRCGRAKRFFNSHVCSCCCNRSAREKQNDWTQTNKT